MAKTVAELKTELAEKNLKIAELSGRLKEATHMIGQLTSRSFHWAGEFEKLIQQAPKDE